MLHMDNETEELILLLQLEDLEEELSHHKGKHREGETPDAELALILAKEEIQEQLQVLHDRRIGPSSIHARETDQTFLTAARAGEDVTERNSDIGQASSSQPARPPAVTAGPSSGRGSEADLQKHAARRQATASLGLSSMLRGLQRLTISDEERAQEDGSSSAFRKGKEREPSTQCQICTNAVHESDLSELVCHDKYCRHCISKVFRDATVIRKAYPPRCCRIPIPLEDVRHLLPAGLITLFQAKAIESETEDGTYCSDPGCSKFILPVYVTHGVATCPSCGTKTCAKCKAAAHDDECPEDPAFKSLNDLAGGEEWQRCYKCKSMVSISTGCNHMICICNAEFCYECGQAWKTCKCEQWTEARLTEAAQQRAVRDQPLNAQLEAVDVARARQSLLGRHECQHQQSGWTRRRREDGFETTCSECSFGNMQWVWECPGCDVRMCMRCRKNRL